MAPYKEWQNAKYGRLGVQDFAELHFTHAPDGKTCAAMATPGNANGSPYPRKMIKTMSDGSGDVVGDAAYGSIKNRSAIRDGGRRAVIDPSLTPRPRGSTPGQRCRGSATSTPARSGILRIGNNVESAFSAMERFGGVVRALKPHTRAVELPSMRTCHYTSI